MTQTVTGTTLTDSEAAQLDYSMCPVSWAAIAGGAAGTIAISMILMLLGTGLGLSFSSPWAGEGMSGTAFTINAAIWLIIVQWVASAFGGYISGRLRHRWTRLHTDEVFFRDTAHGFLSWAVASIFTVAFLAHAMTAAINTGAHAAQGGAMAGMAANGPTHAGPGPRADMGGGEGPYAYFVDSLYRGDRTQPGTAPDVRGETSRILMTGLQGKEVSEDDKAYLATTIETRTGVSHDEAVKRVDNTIAAMKDAEQKAKEAADAARKAAASFSFFTFFSMLIGAFIAAVAGALGGKQRDEY